MLIGASNILPMRSGRRQDAEAETDVQSQAPGSPVDERSRRHRQKGTEARWLIGASAIPLRSVPQQDPEVETGLHSLILGSADVWSREGKGDGARQNGDVVLGDVVAKPETGRAPPVSSVEVQADQELADMNPHTLDGWLPLASWEHHQSDGMVLGIRRDRVHS